MTSKCQIFGFSRECKKDCLLVPIIPTPKTPPRFGVADITAVTVGKRSLLIPACGMITLVIVPYSDHIQPSATMWKQ